MTKNNSTEREGIDPLSSSALEKEFETLSKRYSTSGVCHYDYDSMSLYWYVYDNDISKHLRYDITAKTPIILPLQTRTDCLYELAYILIPFDIVDEIKKERIPLNLTPEQENKLEITNSSVIQRKDHVYYISSNTMPIKYIPPRKKEPITSKTIGGILIALIVPLSTQEIGDCIFSILLSILFLCLNGGWIAVLCLWAYKIKKKLKLLFS